MVYRNGEELAIITVASDQDLGCVRAFSIGPATAETPFKTVLTFLIILSSGMQYFIHRSNYKRDLRRIEDVVREARLAAWGPKMVPVEGQRKVYTLKLDLFLCTQTHPLRSR